MSDLGRGIATGLCVCAAAAIACTEDWSVEAAFLKGLVLLWITVLASVMVRSMISKPKP